MADRAAGFFRQRIRADAEDWNSLLFTGFRSRKIRLAAARTHRRLPADRVYRPLVDDRYFYDFDSGGAG